MKGNENGVENGRKAAEAAAATSLASNEKYFTTRTSETSKCPSHRVSDCPGRRKPRPVSGASFRDRRAARSRGLSRRAVRRFRLVFVRREFRDAREPCCQRTVGRPAFGRFVFQSRTPCVCARDATTGKRFLRERVTRICEILNGARGPVGTTAAGPRVTGNNLPDP